MVLERRRLEHVEILTLNRPESANALNPELFGALARASVELAADADVRAVIITGAGERVFCGGMDLAAFSRGEAMPTPTEQERAVSITGGRFPKPLIAAVNGAAVGGGFELVLACDLVVAADHARFGLPEVKRGLYAAGGGTMLSTRIPLTVALELGLTGEPIGAAVARDLGLVNRVVPAADIVDEALALADRIVANGPLGVQLTKRLMRAAVSDSPTLGIGTAEETTAVFSSNDAKEGGQAFLEKRPPRWTGS